jgi:predicted dehydrogenase
MNPEIRWGILGTGFAAVQFAEGLRSVPGTTVTAVASRDETRAQRFARRFAVSRSYARYEDLVSDDAVDVVYVATANPMHRSHCLLSLEAGKAVLCEKPFALTAAEAREVVAAAHRHRRFCMEAIRTRFLPAVHELRRLTAGGAIGRLQTLHAFIGHRVEYDPQSRFFSAALGGGALLDIGVYPISIALVLLGRPQAITSQSLMSPTGVDEEFSAILVYPDDRMAMLGATLRAQWAPDAVITGSAGSIEMNGPLYWADRLTIARAPTIRVGENDPLASRPSTGIMARITQQPLVRAQKARLKAVLRAVRPSSSHYLPYRGNGFTDEAAEVVNCVRQGLLESALSPLDETVGMLEITDEINRQRPITRREYGK